MTEPVLPPLDPNVTADADGNRHELAIGETRLRLLLTAMANATPPERRAPIDGWGGTP